MIEKYVIYNKIGEGAHGEVYRGMDNQSKKQVAIKLEPIESRTRIPEHEYKVYQDIILVILMVLNFYHVIQMFLLRPLKIIPYVFLISVQ